MWDNHEDDEKTERYATTRHPYVLEQPKHWSIQLVEFIFTRRLVLNSLILIMSLVNTFFIINLNQKIELFSTLSIKPYRMDMNDAYIFEDKKMQSLLDVLTNYKVKIIDKNLYSYTEPQDLDEIIRRYEKPPVKKQPRKTIKKPKKKISSKYDSAIKKLQYLSEGDNPANQKEIEDLIEKIEEWENENR